MLGGEVTKVAMSEAAATQDAGGPRGPEGPGASTDWLILQRLDDLRRGQDEMRAEVKGLGGEIKAVENKLNGEIKSLGGEIKALDQKLSGEIKTLDTKMESKIDSVRNWSLGLLLLAIVGLLAKLLLPGA